MQNSIVMLILSLLGTKYSFWENFVQNYQLKLKIWYLDEFEYSEWNDHVNFFCFSTKKSKLFLKAKTWNLE